MAMCAEVLPVVKGLARPMVRPLRSLARRLRAFDGCAVRWGNSRDAEYFYGVWLKHLALLRHAGLDRAPRAVAEFGPGDTLGSGLCALLTGARRYAAFDVGDFTSERGNLMILERLLPLVAADAPRRPQGSWLALERMLGDDVRPSRLGFPDQPAAPSLGERAQALRAALGRVAQAHGPVQVIAPWHARTAPPEAFDVVFSHSALQYEPDLQRLFGYMTAMLRPGGWMSHQVDLTSIGVTRSWDGHRCYGSLAWRMVNLGRPYALNRHAASAYVQAIRGTPGLQLVEAIRHPREADAAPPRHADDEQAAQDARCDHLVLLARKRGG